MGAAHAGTHTCTHTWVFTLACFCSGTRAHNTYTPWARGRHPEAFTHSIDPLPANTGSLDLVVRECLCTFCLGVWERGFLWTMPKTLGGTSA